MHATQITMMYTFDCEVDGNLISEEPGQYEEALIFRVRALSGSARSAEG